MTTELQTLGLNQAAFLDLVHARRSTRSFDPKPLTLSEVETLVEAARWAPSPTNRQPWKFQSIASQDIKDQLREAVTVACQKLLEKQAGSQAKAIEDYLRNFTFFANAPVLFALQVRRTNNRLADPENGSLESDSALLAAGAAMQNILLAAVANGMVACPMSGPMIAKPELEAVLEIESPWSLMAFIPVGWPGPDQPTAPERKRLDLIWTHQP